jgi:hypothetical protein
MGINSILSWPTTLAYLPTLRHQHLKQRTRHGDPRMSQRRTVRKGEVDTPTAATWASNTVASAATGSSGWPVNGAGKRCETVSAGPPRRLDAGAQRSGPRSCYARLSRQRPAHPCFLTLPHRLRKTKSI